MISRVIVVGSACCCCLSSSMWLGGSAIIWLSLPNPTSSFAWPAPQSSPAAAAAHRSSTPIILSHPATTRASSFRASRSSRRHYAREEFDRLPTRNATDGDWEGPWQPAASHAPDMMVVPAETTEIGTAHIILQQHLLEGLMAHQSLLDSMDLPPALERTVEMISLRSIPKNDESHSSSQPTTTTTTTTTMMISILSDVWKARLLLLLSAALYGTNFTIVKSIDDIDGMSVGMASTLRFGFAALAMLPLLFAPIDAELKLAAKERRDGGGGGGVATNGNALSGLWEEPTRLSAGLAGMEIGLYNSVGYLAQAVGLKTTTASKSAFICSLAVVTVPILDFIWGKKLLRRQIIGACLAAFGVFALELGGQQTTITDGDAMSLIQPVVFGLGFWRMEAAMEKFPTEAGRLAAAQLLTVFLVSLTYLVCWSPLGIDGLHLPLVSDACNAIPTASDVMAWLRDPHILGMFVWTGVVTTAFTIYMETLALRTLSATETTLIFSTEPLFGAAFAAVVANECLGMDDAVGAAFIIIGCVVSGMDVSRLFRGPVAESETTSTEK